mgnify:CR=1 FL=1|tara:strand:+ start:2588 stop:3193 length:606 start_codon:yes stop_codon:yes gene_type:complete
MERTSQLILVNKINKEIKLQKVIIWEWILGLMFLITLVQVLSSYYEISNWLSYCLIISITIIVLKFILIHKRIIKTEEKFLIELQSWQIRKNLIDALFYTNQDLANFKKIKERIENNKEFISQAFPQKQEFLYQIEKIRYIVLSDEKFSNEILRESLISQLEEIRMLIIDMRSDTSFVGNYMELLFNIIKTVSNDNITVKE